MVVAALKRMSRSRSCWGLRTLIMTDSMVALGLVAKGRSDSWPLLRLSRQAGAIQLGVGLRAYCRHVEGKFNLADGPSRGFGVGQAPPWSEQYLPHLMAKYRALTANEVVGFRRARRRLRAKGGA